MPHVAAVIPVFNGERFVEHTVQSVLAQTFRDLHLYVVDDGSTDATPGLLARYSGDARVTVLRQENRGQAAAINTALRLGREPFVSIIDADDLWRRDRLETVVPVLESNPELGLVCNDFSRGEAPSAPWTSAWRAYGYRPVESSAFERLLEQNFIMRCAALVRRDCVDRCGGFSEEIGGKCGSDDRDMWLMIARERPIACVHEPLSFVRQSPFRDSGTDRAIESRIRLWEKWTRELRAGPGHLHRKAAVNLAASCFDLGYRRLRGDGDAISGRRYLLRAAIRGYKTVYCLGAVGASLCGMAHRRRIIP